MAGSKQGHAIPENPSTTQHPICGHIWTVPTISKVGLRGTCQEKEGETCRSEAFRQSRVITRKAIGIMGCCGDVEYGLFKSVKVGLRREDALCRSMWSVSINQIAAGLR